MDLHAILLPLRLRVFLQVFPHFREKPVFFTRTVAREEHSHSRPSIALLISICGWNQMEPSRDSVRAFTSLPRSHLTVRSLSWLAARSTHLILTAGLILINLTLAVISVTELLFKHLSGVAREGSLPPTSLSDQFFHSSLSSSPRPWFHSHRLWNHRLLSTLLVAKDLVAPEDDPGVSLADSSLRWSHPPPFFLLSRRLRTHRSHSSF